MFKILARPIANKSNGFKIWIAADKYGASYSTRV